MGKGAGGADPSHKGKQVRKIGNSKKIEFDQFGFVAMRMGKEGATLQRRLNVALNVYGLASARRGLSKRDIYKVLKDLRGTLTKGDVDLSLQCLVELGSIGTPNTTLGHSQLQEDRTACC
jgi:hypothetical protein